MLQHFMQRRSKEAPKEARETEEPQEISSLCNLRHRSWARPSFQDCGGQTAESVTINKMRCYFLL